MRKIITIVFAIVMSIISVSCMGSRLSFINMGDREGHKHAKQIIDALSEDNVDGIRNLLCEEVLNSSGTAEEIEKAMSFFEGRVVSYDIENSFNGRESSEGFRKVMQNITPLIKNIETDTGKTYQMFFSEYLVYKEHKGWVGIDYIFIRNMTGIDMHDKNFSYKNVPFCKIGYDVEGDH